MRTVIPTSVVTACLLTAACGGGSAHLSAGPMPQGGTFTGVWFSPQYGEMQMMQTGNAVVGEYVKDERSGRIQGTAQGDLMRFEWTEERELVEGRPSVTRGRGYFRYSIDPSGKHNLLGEWGIDDDETGGGDWNAYKMQNRRVTMNATSSGGENNGNDDWNDTGEDGSGGGDVGSGGGGGGGGDDSGGGDDLGDLDL